MDWNVERDGRNFVITNLPTPPKMKDGEVRVPGYDNTALIVYWTDGSLSSVTEVGNEMMIALLYIARHRPEIQKGDRFVMRRQLLLEVR